MDVRAVVKVAQMDMIPCSWKPRMRDLSFGSEDGSMYRWTFHGGRCYASTVWVSGELVGWACITWHEDDLPVVGVYISEEHRGKGLARVAAETLLEHMDLDPGTAVYAVSENWAAWVRVLRKFGLVHFEWV